MKRDLYQEVTDRIVSLLEAGTTPWQKDWSQRPGDGVPCNAVTNRPYSGINVLIYWISAQQGFSQPRYLTYNQAKKAGGNVRKGEKGDKVYLFQPITVKDKKTDEEKKIPLIREWTVFNVEQCDNLPENVVHGKPARALNKDEREELADEFVKATGADFREGKGSPMYVPSKDFITVPNFKSFKSKEGYYGAVFHELGHWTGHKARLDRDLKLRFDTQSYAMEELVAELTAAFLCAEFGFNYETNNAAYLGHWISVMKADKRAIFTATSAAQKAANYLRGKALVEEVVDEEAVAA